MTALGWLEQAACRGLPTDLWFPGRGEDATQARRVCAGCPVRAECLTLGLREPFGVWGGQAEGQRKRSRRGMPFEVTCAECDRPFLTTHHRVYCSGTCLRRSRAATARAKARAKAGA